MATKLTAFLAFTVCVRALTAQQAVDGAFEFVHSVAVNGTYDPAYTGQDPWDLYSGTAGVALFALEYHTHAGDARALSLARDLGDRLAAAYDSIIANDPKYVPYFWHWGKSGLAFVMRELAHRLPERSDVYLAVAARADAAVVSHFLTEGVSVNGLRRGASGVGLYLAHVLRTGAYDSDPAFKDSVERALSRITEDLLANAIKAKTGTKWVFERRSGAEMPGYSYGTAGVMHFFSSLYAMTRNATHLAAAVEGARYVESIADLTDGGCLVPYGVPADLQVKHYLGECHGNSGLIKALVGVHIASGDEHWLDLADRAALSLVERTKGEYNFWVAQVPRLQYYWDNLSVCDGNAAAIEALALLRRLRPGAVCDQGITGLVENVLERAHVDAAQVSWVQAEWRTSPKTMTQQVGLYIGAAGVAHTLMLLDNPTARIALPDYTFSLA